MIVIRSTVIIFNQCALIIIMLTIAYITSNGYIWKKAPEKYCTQLIYGEIRQEVMVKKRPWFDI